MTRDEALTIVGMIANHWPGPHWNTDTLDAYATAIERLDAATATAAVITAVNELEFYPKVATLHDFYDIERAKNRAAEEKPERQWPQKREVVPLWVRRWVAARYLHRQFGRDQDMRSFPEQGQWANPYTDPMPPDAWLEEAEHVTDDKVWKSIGG